MSIQDDAQAAVEAAQKVRDDLAATPPTPPTSTLPGIEIVEVHYVDGTVVHLVPESTGEPEPTPEAETPKPTAPVPDGPGTDAEPVPDGPTFAEASAKENAGE